MTERQRTAAGGRIYDQQYHAEGAVKMATTGDDLSPRKTLLVFVVIIGCFAVLWMKLFYPILLTNASGHIKPSSIDKTTGCCDVISEIDVNMIKIMSELCSSIIETNFEQPPKPKQIVTECRRAVLEKCGIDISAALQERATLGHSVRQILEEVRSLNGSLCLKYNFGVSPSKLGVPHRVTVNLDYSASIRQERPSHLRSEMVHPAFRERGRAIPQPEAFKRAGPSPRIIEGRPGPVPGIRPAMGGAGHVVLSKQQHTGVMGLLMPIYTVGILIFFTYTLMKVIYKKEPDPYACLYPPVQTDEHFRKEVFQSSHTQFGHRHTTDSKLVVNAVSALLEEVDQEIRARQKSNEGDAVTNETSPKPQEEDQGSVKVMGMETTASCEGGKKWSRPDSPVLPTSRPTQPEPQPVPQEIYLEGTLPPDSQLLVADSATETQKEDEDSAVVLAGKMTLSVISLDSSENGTDESFNPDKKQDVEDEKGTSSSHGSDEFEKIDAYQLEEQIEDLNEQIAIVSQKPIEKSDSDFSFIEELEKINQGILEDINRESVTVQELGGSSYDVLKEIKEQLKLDDELLEVLDQEVKNDTVEQIIQEEITNTLGNTISQYISDGTLEHDVEDKNHDEVRRNDTVEQIIQEEITSTLGDTISQYNSDETPEHDVENKDNNEVQQTEIDSKLQLPEAQTPADDIKEVLTVEDTQSTSESVQQQFADEIPHKEILEIEENDFLSTLISISQREKDERDLSAESPGNDSIQVSEDEPKDISNTPKDDNLIEISTENTERFDIEEITNDAEPQQQIINETESNCDDDEVLEDMQFEENVSDQIANEIRDAGRNGEEERISRDRVNGNDITPRQDSEGDSDESLTDEDDYIEEIIEYVENTDDEGEEIIEVANGVSQTNQDRRNVEN